MSVKRFVCICLLSLGFNANAEVSFEYESSFYDINAYGIDQLTEQIRNEGPNIGSRNSWAVLNWDLNTFYHFESDESGCKFVAEEVEVIAQVTLPRWINLDENKDWVRAWWKDFYAFLSSHENAHFDNVYQAAKSLEQQITELAPSKDCKQAKQEYLHLKHTLLDSVLRQDRRLDATAKKLFFSNKKLFTPLKKGARIVFESGAMRSYIGL